MTFKTNCKIAKGRIDPAPMVDIMFLLLMFLALSSPLVLQPGIGLMELPTSKVPQTATFQGLVVMVKSEELMFFNNQPVTLEGLKAALEVEAKKSRNPELIIKADRQVPHGTMVKIMSLAFEAGIPAVNIATRPELPTAAKPK
jgi:biopolymer transport protein ExbD